ncbi:MAG: hypothetical protein AAGJ40_21180 [Planctomycetota bacterium]
MMKNPYLPATASGESVVFRTTLLRALLLAMIASLAIALLVYGFEALTGIGIPLVYSFPSFYPLRSITYFDPLFGFCLQCLVYGIAVGLANHMGRLKLGLCLLATIHVALVFLCPFLP